MKTDSFCSSSYWMLTQQNKMYTIHLTLSDFVPLPFKKCWLLRIICFNITSIVFTCSIPFHTQRLFSPSTSLYNGAAMFSWRQEISISRSSMQASTLRSRMPLTRTIRGRQSPCTVEYASRVTRVAEKLPQRHGECRNAATGQAT